jgi:RHS Repeat
MTSASGNFAVQGCVTLGGQLTAVHPQGGFAVEVQAAPGANRFPLVVTEANGTVTTKYVDLVVENSIPVIHRYDLNGNLESVAPQATPGSPTRTYQWDAVNRLVGITRILSLTETRKTEFLYNGEGSRIGKKEFINGVKRRGQVSHFNKLIKATSQIRLICKLAEWHPLPRLTSDS